MQAMLPTQTVGGTITSISYNGTPISFSTQVIKGVEYAIFPALTGAYQASIAPPPQVNDLMLSTQGVDAVLGWTHQPQNQAYEVWRSSDPYFTPGDLGSLKLADLSPPTAVYTDTGAVLASTSFYYTVHVTNSVGANNSNTTALFNYAMMPGGSASSSNFTWISVPLVNSSLVMASDLASDIQSDPTFSGSVDAIERWNSVAQSYEPYIVGIPFTDFALEAGSAYRVSVTGGSGPITYTMTGDVPDAALFTYTLRETAGSDFSWIMIPLDRGHLVMASDLATDIETNSSGTVTVVAIERWNAIAQSFEPYIPGLPFTDFTISIGYPYRISVTVPGAGTSVVWPSP